MININQTSENSKIYIQRNITNDEPVINNYVTEDELQEQLKNINIPYLVIDHIKYDDGTWGYGIVSGDFNKVYDAIVNRKPQIMYVPDQQPKVFYIPTVFMYDTSTKKIWVAVSHHNAVDLDFTYYTFEITENLVTQSYQSRNVQEKLVSGENIKTINGNSILGEGDIIIEGGGNGNIVELTQSEYNGITPEPDTLYVISDAPAVEIPDTSNFVDKETLTYEIDNINIALNQKQDTLVSGVNIKTINGNDILGEGDIKIDVDLTGYATEQWVDDKGYLKEIPSEYITETELADKNYVDTSYLNGELEEYAKLSYVEEQLGNINTILENILN